MRFDWQEIDRELTALFEGIDGVALDRAQIGRFAREIRGGSLGPESNRLDAPPRLPEPGDVDALERLKDRERYTELGRQALECGQVAVAVLNGGMATRFGGVVKGIVEAIDGRTFLDIKVAQARRLGPVPFFAMNSFATQRATLDYLEETGLAEHVVPFLQSAALRLTPDGDLLRDARGRVSPYAPGHGDFIEALRRAHLLERLERQSVRVLMLSNVDNLGADPDPLVIGYHLSHGLPLTVEVAESTPDDSGGGPAWVDGRLQVVESFRLPEGVDLASLPYVNANTLCFSLPLLGKDYPLTWFYVEKRVEGRTAIQMERLVGQISAFVDTAYLLIPREGPACRYMPVKTPEDLERIRGDPVLVERIRSSMGLRARL